jgi:hypothetical protein
MTTYASASNFRSLLRQLAEPSLLDRGFDRFKARTTWRTNRERFDVVTFDILGPKGARGASRVAERPISHLSFVVRIGMWMEYLAPPGSHHPSDYAGCHLRVDLPNPTALDEGLYPGIWPLATDASRETLASLIQAATMVIISTGLPWYDAYADARAVYRTLVMAGPETHDPLSIHNIGHPHSVWREELSAYAALRLGDHAGARRHYEAALTLIQGLGFPGRLEEILDPLHQQIEDATA